MAELSDQFRRLAFSTIAIVFLALYVMCLASGLEPETALLRSGLAAGILAVLSRVAVWLLEAEPKPTDLNQAIGPATSGAPAPAVATGRE